MKLILYVIVVCTFSMGGSHIEIKTLNSNATQVGDGNNMTVTNENIEKPTFIEKVDNTSIHTINGPTQIGNHNIQKIKYAVMSEAEIKEIENQITVKQYDELLKKVPKKYLTNIKKYTPHGKIFEIGDLVLVTATGIDINHPLHDSGQYAFTRINMGVVIGVVGDMIEVFWDKQKYVSQHGEVELKKFISKIKYDYVKRKFTYRDSVFLKRGNK